MIVHPSRRYEPVWWAYVKKLEKKHMTLAATTSDARIHIRECSCPTHRVDVSE